MQPSPRLQGMSAVDRKDDEDENEDKFLDDLGDAKDALEP